MTVAEMQAEIRQICALNSTDPLVSDAMLLALLNEEYEQLARDSRCFRRRQVISPIIQAKATGTLTFSSPLTNDYFVIQGRAYTLTTATPTTAYYVKIGGDDWTTASNVADAINGIGVGTTCGAGTLANPHVTATDFTNTVTLTAILYGTVGNGYTLTESTTGARIVKSGATMSGGVDGREYALPTDACELLNLTYGATQLVPMPASSLDAMNNGSMAWRNVTAGSPQYFYFVGGNRFAVDTPPDGQKAFIAEFTFTPSAVTGGVAVLTTGSPDARIPEYAHKLLTYRTARTLLTTVLADVQDGSDKRLALCDLMEKRLYSRFMEGFVSA